MPANLISGKKQTKSKFSKYANPTFITKGDNLLTGVVKSDFGKTAYYDTEQTIPNFYTPELTPETWLLPRSRAEILRWCRLFFNLDPYINSILTMHAQYPISNFRLSYKDKDTEAFFNRKLFDNKEFSWIDFLEQVMLSYFKMGEAVVWADWSESKGTWNGFSLIDPSLIEYKEDPISGEVEMSIIPTRELKQMLADGLKQGRTDIPVEYIRCVQENQKIPLDATGTEPNYLTGKKYSPAKVFMLARKTDPGATRGTPITQCARYSTKIKLLDGTTKCIGDLYKDGAKDFWVYSIDDNGNITPKKASKVIYQGKKLTYDITLDNGEVLGFTEDHPFLMRDGIWKEVKDLKPGDSLMPFNCLNSIKVVSVEKADIEDVYDIECVDGTHNFAVACEDGSGVFVHNCLFKTLIYQDKIKLAQIACADRLHLPIEIWTIGSYTGDPQTSIIPDDSMIGEVREAIRQATMQPPFSIFVPPYIKYEAVGVNGKLLSVYEDLGYVENCIFVGLGVNKNLILGAGPSFSSSKQTSLFKLIKMYKMLRLKLEAFIKRYILLPIARANDIKDEYGDYVVPNIEWEESLQPEQDVEKFNNVLKLWDKGLVSTTTVYEYFPGKLDINLEKQRLEMERGSIWDKGTDRLGSKSQRPDLNEKKPDTGNKPSMPTPSDGSKPAEGLPPPMGGDVEEGGEPESTEVPEAPEEVPAEQ